MTTVQITKIDGSIVTTHGDMNDKLFAYLGKSRGWASYRVIDDGIVPEMTDKERELKAYYDDKAAVEKAMSY
jgi:hypothetical protein